MWLRRVWNDWFYRLTTGLVPGALAGLVGGLVFGATMSGIGQLTAISSMAHIDSAPVGFIIVLVGATLIGAGFGALVWYQQPGAGETLFWGLVYGTFWWYLGPLTLLPLVRGDGVTWTLDSTQAAFSVLPGLVLYGATLGLALVFFQWRQHYPDKPLHINGGALFRGGLAGLFAAGLLGAALNSQNQLLNATNLTEDASKLAAWLITLLIGVRAGLVVGRSPSSVCRTAGLPALWRRRGPVLPMARRPGKSAVFRHYRWQQ